MSAITSPDQWRQGAPGHLHLVFVPGIVKPINAGSAKIAKTIVSALNHHDELLEALRVATEYVALYTGNGARNEFPDWARDAAGQADPEKVVARCRDIIAKVGGQS